MYQARASSTGAARRRPSSLACFAATLAAAAASIGLLAAARGAPPKQRAPESKTNVFASRRDAAAMLLGYFERMCRPKPFEVRTGAELKAHRQGLRSKLLACAGLWPLPQRPPLDVRKSDPIDHEWCTVRRVYYQLWPNVYAGGLLYMPKRLAERPAPAVLCPHGHWANGNAHPVVQTRCLVLAKMGYVVFSSSQNHYEDPAWGVSHQTLMIWNNVRALDLLAGLAEVDPKRIGCTGGSGGGLQTQMIVAVDDRVAAASICGLTCDYREIVFAGRHHCACNHFPNIMRYTDEPEISALGLAVPAAVRRGGVPLPTPVQYLTMNDWTRSFAKNNFPTVRRLYEANGAAGRTDCQYWPTGHNYDKAKRERMYGWMERWLRGRGDGHSVPEPPTKTLPPKALLGIKAAVPGNKGFGYISRLYAGKFRPATPKIRSQKQWLAYRRRMKKALRDLLGEHALVCPGPAKHVGREQSDGLIIERVLCPSERGISVPTLLLRPAASKGKLPLVVICDDRGKAAMLSESGAGSAAARARDGCLVALPDVRFVGEFSLRAIAGLTKDLLTFKACSPLGEGKPASFDRVWERNAMLWGRPIPGMATADILAVLSCIGGREDVRADRVSLVARGRLAIAALFAATSDDRVGVVELDLQGRCFRKRNLPLVPFVLRHGDVLHWAALLAYRRLTLANVPKEAGDPAWLRDVFKAVGSADGLRLRGSKPPKK